MNNENNNNNNNKDDNNQLVIIEEKIQKPNSDLIIKKYMRGKMLGKGGFAKCYEATSLETKRTVAVKIIPKQILIKNRAKQKLISEIKIHKSLSHQNVVIFEHVFEDHENVYILLELCTNNTLNELIKKRKRLTDIEVQCFILQIINGLKYLHSRRVIHRDLKLGNLFLSDRMEIKLGDFGLAAKLEFDGEKKHTICGTPNYIAPEILEGKQGHSYQVDVWSLGVIIYTLLIGKPPFETSDIKTTYKKIKQNSYSFPDNIPISDDAKHLITIILNLEPLKRPNLEEIICHPFMKGTIPKYLPHTVLSYPPSVSYIKQFLPEKKVNVFKINQQPLRVINTPNPFTKSENDTQKIQSSNNINKLTPQASNNIPQIRALATAKNWYGYQSQKNPFQMQAVDFKLKNNGKNFTATSTTSFKNMPTIQNQQCNTSNNNQILYSRPSLAVDQSQRIWIISWIDYSSKYGLGYTLFNGFTGVFFNDSTNIIFNPNNNLVEYFEKQSNQDVDGYIKFNLENYPFELKKKITLLTLFRNYLKDQKPNIIQEFTNTQANQNQTYVQKWMKTKHAMIFRLSNKIVQVSFVDKTQIILSSENKQVTYFDRKGAKQNYSLSTALENSNKEMSKRLKYTKDILTQMLSNKNINEPNNLNLDDKELFN